MREIFKYGSVRGVLSLRILLIRRGSDVYSTISTILNTTWDDDIDEMFAEIDEITERTNGNYKDADANYKDADAYDKLWKTLDVLSSELKKL